MASMLNLLLALLHTAHSSFKSHRHLALENLALRQRHPWDLPNIVRGDTSVTFAPRRENARMSLRATRLCLTSPTMAAHLRYEALDESPISFIV